MGFSSPNTARNYIMLDSKIRRCFFMLNFLKQKRKIENNQPTKTAHTVVVYSTPVCVWCNEVKKYLKKHKIEYKDYDISNNLAKRMEMIKLSGQMNVPVIVISGKIVVGFDKREIDRLLHI
jgi:glutaredoxin-like YruB-family protein